MRAEVEARIAKRLDELGGVPGFRRLGDCRVSAYADIREWEYQRDEKVASYVVPVSITGDEYIRVAGNDQLLMRLVACKLELAKINAEAMLGY